MLKRLLSVINSWGCKIPRIFKVGNFQWEFIGMYWELTEINWKFFKLNVGNLNVVGKNIFLQHNLG